MIDTDVYIYGGESTFHELQNFLGERPGNYRIDPYYVRRGMGNKPYFWDAINKKWVGIRLGDKFSFDNDNIAVQEKVNG